MFQANRDRKASQSKPFQKIAEGPHERPSFQKLAGTRLNMLADNGKSVAKDQASIVQGVDPLPAGAAAPSLSARPLQRLAAVRDVGVENVSEPIAVGAGSDTKGRK